MAYDIGIVVGIDGDAKLKQQLQSINKETKNYKSALKELETEYDRNMSKQEKLAQKTEILDKKYQAQQNQVNLLKSKLEELRNAEQQDADSINYYAEQYNKARAALNQTEQELKELQSGLVQTGNAMQAFGEKMQSAGQKISAVGGQLSAAVTLPLAALGAAAIKAESEFGAAMSKVEALSGATAEQMARLEEKALSLAASSKWTAAEVASGFSYMALAGWKTEDMLQGISAVTDLAAASGEDLSTISDIVTDDLTAFGLSAKDAGHFADVLAQTAANSNTTVAGMGEAFKYAAPLAGALGYDVEDVALATGLMANNSIKASMAGTTLRSWLTRMAKPTKDSAQAMENLGISLTDAEGNMRPLVDVMMDMRDGFSRMSETEKAANAAMLGGQRAMSGLLAIANSSDEDFNNLINAIENADGAAGHMAETMLHNTQGSLTLMKSALEGAAIAAGKALAPTVTNLAKMVQRAANAFSGLTKSQQKHIVKMLAIAAAAGPVLAIGGKIISIIGGITKAGGKLLTWAGKVIISSNASAAATAADAIAKGADADATARAAASQALFNKALAASPILLFVGALGAAAGAAVALSKEFINNQNEARRAADEIRDSVESTRSGLNDLRQNLVDNTAAAEGTTKQAEYLINRLEELKGASDPASLHEMQTIVSRLNELYPDMSLAINDVTGELTKSTGEIRKFTEEAEKSAKATAYAKAQEEAYTELARAEIDLTAATEERKKWEDEIYAAEQKKQKLIESNTAGTYDAAASGKTYSQALQEETQNIIWLQNQLKYYTDTEAEAKAAYDDAKNSVDYATIAYEEYTNTVSAADQLQQQNIQTLTNTISATDQLAASWMSLDATEQASLAELAENIVSVTNNTQQAVQSQLDTFDHFKGEFKLTGDDLLDNLQSQVEGVEKWEEQLTYLAEQGIDEGILKKLAEMGPQGAEYVNAFVELAGQGKLSEANEYWLQMMNISGFENEAGQQLATAIGTTMAGGQDEINRMSEELGLAMNSAGVYTVQGLIDGILSQQQAASDAMAALGDEVNEGYTESMDQNSPSKRMDQNGRYTIQGLINGFNAQKAAVISTAKTIGACAAYVGTVAMEKVNQAYNAGINVARGLANGIRDGRSYVIQAARDTAKAAIDAANAKLQIGSPSKAFYKIGQFTIAGFVNALDDGARNVAQTMAETFAPNTYAAAYYPGMVSGSAYNTNVGGMTFNIYAAEGQDVNAIARAVSNQVARELTRRAVG